MASDLQELFRINKEGMDIGRREGFREGYIAGLEKALASFPRPSSTTQWDPQEEIRAEIERARNGEPLS